MHPDPLTTLSAFLARWAARMDTPGATTYIPSADVCALSLTTTIMQTEGAHAGDTLAALWHHCARPPMETTLSLDGRFRRVAIITAGPIAAWTIYEDLTLGTLSISSHHLIEIAAACGAASLTDASLTHGEALAAFAATLPTR